MALINCPECGKEVSDKAKVCTNCGVKIKKKSNKILKLVISIVVVILIFVVGIFYFINKQNQEKLISQYKEQASVVDNQISSILDGSVSDANTIIDIKKQYEALDENVKNYVTNKEDFENFVIEINSENFKDYFDIIVEFSNMQTNLTSKFFLNEYSNTADETITIQPKADFICENVVVNLNLDLVGWENGNVENARLEKDGTYSKMKEINYDTVGLKAFEPTYYEDNLIIGEVTGKISFN